MAKGKMADVCGEQLTERAVTKDVTHRCVKTLDDEGRHSDGAEPHRCYCSKIYIYTDRG